MRMDPSLAGLTAAGYGAPALEIPYDPIPSYLLEFDQPTADSFSPGLVSQWLSQLETDGFFPEEDEGVGGAGASRPDAEGYRRCVDEILCKIDELQTRAREVTQFFAKKQQPKGGILSTKEKDKERPAVGGHKKDVEKVRREGVCSKRMQELMRQFGTILRQISQHKHAWLFMEPVDVDRYDAPDYYEVIKKPMDLGTIRKRLDAKDSNGYKSVREVYSDVRLVFTNAMTYNSKDHNAYIMAEELLEKFEEKWQLLLPKVVEEEGREKELERHTPEALLIPEEIAMTTVARGAHSELDELSMRLQELREMVVMNCRKITIEEKKRIADAIQTFPSDEVNKALNLISLLNPTFPASSLNLDINVDALDQSTLWRLKFHVEAVMERQATNKIQEENTKRKRQISNALAISARKKKKKKLSQEGNPNPVC